MYFYKRLYVSDSLKKSRRKVCWNLKHNRGQADIYVISLAAGKDLFDVFHCAVLQQKEFPRKELRVMGIAGGREEALKLCSRMVSDFHAKYDILRFKELFPVREEKNFRR